MTITSGPTMVEPGTTVAAAGKIMKERSFGSVMVGETGQAVGLISESDIVRKVVAQGKSPDSVKVEEIMSTPLITADIKTPVYEIYRTMADRGIRHLVITEEGRQVGFISVKDLLRRPII